MSIVRTGRFSFVLTTKCVSCKRAEFRKGTGWPTTGGELCPDCKGTCSVVEDLADLCPVNQHESWL
jgi:hypothetical protein